MIGPQQRISILKDSLRFLRKARDNLAEAGAPRATNAVRRALKSTEGALRHAELAPYRESRQAGRG